LPDACGLGGDLMILVADPEGRTTAVNGNGAAPERVSREIPADGGGTAAVPGFIAGMVAAHERVGSLSRERVFAPAVRLAADGFAVGDELKAALDRQRPRLERCSGAWPLLAPTIDVGRVVKLPRLAALLEAIARQGRAAFYDGPAAAAVAAAAQADGGTIATHDLAGYSAIVRPPVSIGFDGARIEVSPPTSQGILLLVALKWLMQHAAEAASNAERVHLQLQAIEQCFAYRSEVAQDDAENRLLVRAALPHVDVAATLVGPRGYNHTAAITASDSQGWVVSALASVFDDFGSATLVPEYDFHLNSRLLGFDKTGPNAPAPRRRPVHTLAPMIVRTPQRVIGIATPGADGQVQTLLQILVSVLEDQLPLQVALHEPRWRLVDGDVVVEEGFDQQLIGALKSHSRQVRVVAAGDPLFGAVSAAVAPCDGGTLEAMSDPRREAWAGVAV
jgi:gamma-glutamyltranspeptidase/glutathione hydrolase